jgi:hypothetical protein
MPQAKKPSKRKHRACASAIMHYLLIAASGAALAITLWAGFGEAQATPLSLSGPTTPRVPALDVAYKRRHESHYKSHACTGDEIPELQRYQPQVRWPSSMRCHPYH